MICPNCYSGCEPLESEFARICVAPKCRRKIAMGSEAEDRMLLVEIDDGMTRYTSKRLLAGLFGDGGTRVHGERWSRVRL